MITKFRFTFKKSNGEVKEVITELEHLIAGVLSELHLFGWTLFKTEQFIGITDKHGKEIYGGIDGAKGDRIRAINMETGNEVEGFVYFKSGAFGIDTKDGFITFPFLLCDAEVVPPDQLSDELKKELIQTAAVCVSILECIETGESGL